MASELGYAGVPKLAQSMKLEWTDAALADLDCFAEFLDREHPALAAMQLLEAAHPGFGKD
jgi:hypothetical protein